MREEQADCSKRGRSVQDTKGHPHKGSSQVCPQSQRTDKDRTSEKQSGKSRANKLQKWYWEHLLGPPPACPKPSATYPEASLGLVVP